MINNDPNFFNLNGTNTTLSPTTIPEGGLFLHRFMCGIPHGMLSFEPVPNFYSILFSLLYISQHKMQNVFAFHSLKKYYFVSQKKKDFDQFYVFVQNKVNKYLKPLLKYS